MMYKLITPLAILFMTASSSDLRAACCITLNQGGPTIRGSGKIVTQTRQVGRFNAISIPVGGTVVIEKTGTPGVTISADDNLISMFTTTVKGGTLELSFQQGKSIHATVPQYRISVADLRSIEISASAEVTATRLGEERLAVAISGDGTVHLAGRANELSIDVEGSGTIEAMELAARRSQISISGSATVNVNVADNLDIDISGSGEVAYKGSPRIRKNITGSGEVVRK